MELFNLASEDPLQQKTLGLHANRGRTHERLTEGHDVIGAVAHKADLSITTHRDQIQLSRCI